MPTDLLMFKTRQGIETVSCVCLLQDQWGHVEEIELVNDGSGLGFGIVGGKATGMVVRTVVPDSVAHKVCFCASYMFCQCILGKIMGHF